MESPPKRMTRARAAAKATSGPKTTKITTAAAKAKSTAISSTRSTAAKRKTRADDNEDGEDEAQQPEPATTARGRARSVAEGANITTTAPVRTTRGRPAKKAATEATREPSLTTTKSARGRPKKVVELEPEVEPAKKTTRARAAPVTTTVKKSVKFQEPDKENVEPPAKKRPVTAGLRGRPARRGGAACARNTRAATTTTTTVQNTEAQEEKKPLSPKKITQVAFSRSTEDSEDELAGDQTPVKPMQKSPVKPPARAFAAKQSELSLEQDDTIQINNAILNGPDLTSTALVSPTKRAPASPFKDTMKTPARKLGASIQLPGSVLKSTIKPGLTAPTPSRNTMLQSAAKRPQSPIKGLAVGSVQKPQLGGSQSVKKASFLQSPAKRAMPGLQSITEPRRQDDEGPPIMKPLVLATPTPASSLRPSQRMMMEDTPGEEAEDSTEDGFDLSIDNIQFPGRLSAVLPRHADPVLNPSPKKSAPELSLVEETTLRDEEDEIVETRLIEEEQEVPSVLTPTEPAEPMEEIDDPMDIDMVAVEIEVTESRRASTSTTPTQSPAQAQNPMFQLRGEDQDAGHEVDSEDEDEISFARNVPATPTSREGSRRATMGLTSLADQLGAWTAHSPQKLTLPTNTPQPNSSLQTQEAVQLKNPTPAASGHFFEDEMMTRPEVGPSGEPDVDEIVFDDIKVINEDLALAHEANEMSLMEPEQAAEEAHHQSFDDTLSDASQEYGDENEMPVDPALSGQASFATPIRPFKQTFHTTTKVPLKPADDSTPSPLKKRSFSASRAAPKRPGGGVSRSATVISYSHEKQTNAPSAPVTPNKNDLWSSMGTPARTPRRDLNPALLRGAVVHVDVHTSEGADASHIFVELLTQMGARCVKNWAWNPDSPSNGDSSSPKIGITHVVYKDGGKRTMEKVRQTHGVVHCVGVSWVLDCERENEWLEERPYVIDTSTIPRGGARRRKSMEPKALANMNGTLVSSASKSSSSSREQQSPNTPMNRRQSTAWMYTPSDRAEDEDEDEQHDDIEWSKFILTPVPKTPAPEAVARYAADIPETPSDFSEDIDDSPTKRQALLMQTCPPKSNPFRDLGSGVLEEDKDEQVVLRLMAARRKSLQFAPKIGSPLSRTWA